jgi:3-oxoacyl-[acyl-carrier protein] reductase
MNTMKQRIAVITGGASGLGLAAALKLSSQGVAVSIWDQSAASLQSARAAFGKGAVLQTLEVDVADPASIVAAAERTRKELGDPSILIAAAAVSGPAAAFTEWTLEDFRRVLDVNLIGIHLTCQALIPAMVRAGWGRVALVASVAGKEGNVQQSGYVASKAGVIGYVKCLGKELASTGVLVNAIAPTVFDTPMLRQVTEAGPEMIASMKAKVPMGRLGQPEEFGEMAAWVCSDSCSFTTGTTFDLSGGRTTY